MKVRCGACRTEFDVDGPGRHACSACGAVNQVTGGMPEGPQAQQMPPPQQPGMVPPFQDPAPPMPAPTALPKVACPECSFEFVVGDIEVATCPNCSAEVQV